MIKYFGLNNLKVMRKINYLIVLIFSVAFTSCFDVDDNLVESIEGQPNTFGFVDRNGSISGIADGSSYEFYFPVEIEGPSSELLSGDFTALISADESSTAEEGVHYTLEQTSVTATEEGNYRALFKVTLLTDGIVAPLEKNPKLVLNVADISASGSGSVIESGAQLSLDLLYLCPSYLAGNYKVFITREDGVYREYDDVITETGPGQYRGLSVGHWAPGGIGGEPGFDFIDVCDVIIVPQQNLVNLYSNQVFQAGDSYVTPEGNLHIEYAITFGSAPDGLKYVVEYIKQ